MIRSLTGWIMESLDVARTRQRLALLDEDRLRDLGITRAEAMTEARRPIWDRGAGAGPLRHPPRLVVGRPIVGRDGRC